MDGGPFSRALTRSGIITIRIDGAHLKAPKGITVRRAIELAGVTFGAFPGDGDIFAPCGVGGCFSCSVLADGALVRP